MADANAIALRVCNACRETKPLSDFGRNCNYPDGVHRACKACNCARSRNYRKTSDGWLIRQRERQAAEKARRHAERLARESSPEWIAAKQAIKRAAKDRANARSRKKYAENIEASRAKVRAKRLANPQVVAESKRKWCARKAGTPEYVVNYRMSGRMYHALRRGKEGRTWREAVDYSLADLIAHLERQFLKGMGWHNMGEWHIDHIVPLVSFQITGFDDPSFRRAWALSNLRPLWAKDNVSKGGRVTTLL